MPFFKRTAISLACTLAFAGAVQPFQQEDPAQLTTIRVSVDLVQVDAIVTNSKDEPVTDLTADDFIILQDGKPQEITHFSFIRTTAPAPPKKPAVEKGKAKPAPPPPAMPVKRETVRRTYALLVDDLGLSFESTVRVRESIRKWLDNEMQPNDLVAVMRTGGSVGSLQQFTNDRRMLYAAADRITYNAASRIGVSSFSTVSGAAPSTRDAYGFQLPMPQEERDLQFTLFTLGSIEYVVDALKELPGRKNLVLFSESMKVNFDGCGGQSQGRDIVIKDRLRRLMDAANKSTVVIHSIDPRGVAYTGLTAQDSIADGSIATQAISQRQCELVSSQDGMVMLAEQTGGLFISNRNDIARALKVVADDGNGYYLIGYPPDEKTVAEMKQGRGRFHDIKVQVKRPGLRVRSRAEFFSTPDTKKIPPDLLSRPDQVKQALESPFAGGDLRVRLTALFSQTKDGKSLINALLHFDANQLVFTEQPDDWHKAVIEITAGLFTYDGEQIDFADKKWNVEAKGKTFEYMQKHGISFLMNVPVKQPGIYQMRLVLRDTANGKLGNATQVIEVPNVRKGKLALSGILLAADRTQSEVAANQAEGVIEADSKKTPAVRIFEAGETIGWAYQILNAKAGKDRKPQIETQVRLFHEGHQVYEGAPSLLKSEALGSSKRMIAVDQMHLKALPPGYYVLQIAVTDTLAGKKDQRAVQSIDFDAQSPEPAR